MPSLCHYLDVCVPRNACYCEYKSIHVTETKIIIVNILTQGRGIYTC